MSGNFSFAEKVYLNKTFPCCASLRRVCTFSTTIEKSVLLLQFVSLDLRINLGEI